MRVAIEETVSLARSPHNASLGRDLEGGRVVGGAGARPDLRILATSRESMGIAGENIVLEPSLSLPDGVLGAEVCDIESRIGRGVGIEPSSRPGVYLRQEWGLV